MQSVLIKSFTLAKRPRSMYKIRTKYMGTITSDMGYQDLA